MKLLFHWSKLVVHWLNLLADLQIRCGSDYETVRQTLQRIIDRDPKLAAADIAFARVNSPAELSHHPHLRRITVATPNGPVSYPAPPRQDDRAGRRYGPVPAVGEHTEKVRAEFMATAVH